MNFFLVKGRLVPYDGFSHRVNNLSSDVVALILQYKGREHDILRMGLFDNPSFLVPRIMSINAVMDLQAPDQQDDILEFFEWLNNMFKPFLAHVQGVIPDVYRQIDSYLIERRPGLTFEKIMDVLDEHINGSHAFCMIRAISLQKTSPSRHCENRHKRILGLAIAKLQRNPCMVYCNIGQLLGLPIQFQYEEDLQIRRFSNLGRIFKLHGPSFYGKHLVMTYCHFVCDRLLNDGHFVYSCLRRVCSKSFL